MPAAPACSPMAMRAISCSASRWCWPTGAICNGLSKLKKDNTGYDLKNLFIGAEGTLGIITAAVLKLFPQPARDRDGVRRRAVAAGRARPVQSGARSAPAAALTGVRADAAHRRRVRASSTCRGMPRSARPRRMPWYVLIEIVVAGADDGLRDDARGRARATASSAGLVEDAAIAGERSSSASVLAAARDALRGAEARGRLDQARRLGAGRGVPAFHRRGRRGRGRRSMPGARPVPFGHIGDGNIHFNITQPDGADKAAFLARWDEMNAVVHDIVAKYRRLDLGRARHRPAEARPAADVKDPVALDLMRALKRTLDPKASSIRARCSVSKRSKQRRLPVVLLYPSSPRALRLRRLRLARFRRTGSISVGVVVHNAIDRRRHLEDLREVLTAPAQQRGRGLRHRHCAPSSQRSKASGGRITGMRSCSGASCGSPRVVTMAAVSISSPFGPIQVSHKPAKAIGPPLRARM